MLKKSFLALFSALFVVISILFSGDHVSAQEVEPVNVYLFYGDGCPHCAKEKNFLQNIKTIYTDEVNIMQFEVYYNLQNADLFGALVESTGSDVAGVPFLVIGNQTVVGYDSDKTTGKEIRELIDKCLSEDCEDVLYNAVFESGFDIDNIEFVGDNNEEIEENNEESNEEETSGTTISVPFWGRVDLSTLSLPIATFLIAFMDGFNPCAMWILIFLITMLINMKDRKRLYALGSIFIITSGAVYFIFLAAWFNFFKFIGYAYWIKVIIGIVAIVSGILHVKNALTSKGECHVVDADQRKSIMQRIKDITKKKSFLLAVAGIMTLAVSVNLIEVVCSAGLPSIYTNLLSSAELTTLEYYGYLLFYTIIFMLDDLVIFFIAVKTFEVTGITNKYTKWSSIIGGVLIFIIGILLIFKPDLLMFG